jgi:glycopeptide antibiotics resistance protein
MKEIVRNVFNYTWPMIFIASIIIIILRVSWLIKNKRSFVLYKEILMLMFLVYILLLFQIVTYQDVAYSNSNFEPFKEILRYHLGSNLFYKNVIGNMLMFIPYGMFVGYYLNIKKVRDILLLSIAASLSIESTQLLIGRVFDVDDIILNVIGAVIGYFLYKFTRSFVNKWPKFLKNTIFFNIILIAVVIMTIIYITSVFK